MTNPVRTAAVHHVTLTVSDVQRSRDFYATALNFKFVGDFGPRALMSNGSFILALSPGPDPDRAIPNDRFNENRIGLDHVSFSVDSQADLEAAMRHFDALGIDHGEINPLPAFGISVLAFRDPDNIQIELSAPLAG